jgi:hypothetical protein
MNHNSPNLILRFLLEVAALLSLGMWGRSLSGGSIGIFLMILVPVTAAVLWGTFNVKGDPSRSGKAPVPVPGWVRLTLELVFFGVSAWALSTRYVLAGLGFGILVILHYLFSLDRIKWLLRQ